jgi:hypothetical protein
LPAFRTVHHLSVTKSRGKTTEISIRVFLKQIGQRLVQQRFSAQDAKKVRTGLFGFGHNPVEHFGLKSAVLLFVDHPAALTMQVAIVGNRYKMESREKYSFFLPPLKTSKRQRSFNTHVHNKFIQAFTIGFPKYIFEDSHIFRLNHIRIFHVSSILRALCAVPLLPAAQAGAKQIPAHRSSLFKAEIASYPRNHWPRSFPALLLQAGHLRNPRI